jgi:hypothetical protein
MHKVLDRARADFATKMASMREAVLTVEGQTLKADVATQSRTFNEFVEAADFAVVEDAYKRASRILSPDLATTYAEHLASQDEDAEDGEEALMDAHTLVAAMGLVPEIKDVLEAAAEDQSNLWLNQYRAAIAALSDERQDVYREIRELSAHPLDVSLARPKAWLQPTSAKEADGTETALPRYEKHLMCDGEKLFPIEFDAKGEKVVLEAEMKKPGRLAWYRNPPRPSQDSLGIVYDDAGEMRIVRPDFVFFSLHVDGSVVADIVDPHGHHLADALPKLRGFARYAELNGQAYGRIEAIAEVDGSYRLLDLKKPEVRLAVATAASAKAAYAGPGSAPYNS